MIKKIYLRSSVVRNFEMSLKTKLLLLEILIDNVIVYIFLAVFFYTQIYYRRNYTMSFTALIYFGCKAEPSSGSHRS
jgi:hypothetical protein